ncbi:MAG: hypothetical protein QME46_11080 [Thermoanaerobacteraceae bacterium]|nr:hypothetical protein [Thermoanaerobacteraceae bacterium]
MNELVAVKNLLKGKLLSTLMDFKNIINENGNNNSQIIKEKISAIRFFLYRLKYFCGNDVENVLRELLDIPLFIDSSLLQEYPGFCIDLLSILNNPDLKFQEGQMKYIRLILMQASGVKDSPMPRKYLLDGVKSDSKTERLIASNALVKCSYFNQEVNDFDRELILRDIMERNSSIVANGIYLMRRNGKGIEGIDKVIDCSSNNIINNAVTTDINIDIFSQPEDITEIDPYNMPVIDPDDPYNYT